MGGMRGEVRGRSQIETYEEYVRKTEGDPDGGWDPHPRFKKACKRSMAFDPVKKEWVLEWYWHS